jgi:hypothetical protein
MALTRIGPNQSINLASNVTGTLPSGNLPAGSILQVVQAFKSDAFSSTSNGFFDVTGLSASITPSNSSNKVLIISDIALGSSDLYAYNHGFKVLRGSTDVGVSTFASTNYSGGANMYLTNGVIPHLFGNSKTFLDSPSTTSATTYKIQATKNSSDGTLYINRRGAGTSIGGTSSLTLMEISA